MAAVEVIPVKPEIVGFDKNANVFIAEIEVPASPDQPTEKKKQVPVFVLNNSDFIDLQLYLASGLKLPRSEDLFSSTFPKAAFDEYIHSDPTLYDGLKSQLPVIHQHCSDFQGKTIGPMINLGGYISNFAEDAAEHHKDILEGINTIVSATTKKGDPAVDDAKASIRNNLRKLARKSESTQDECVKLGQELSEFKTVTETDQKTIELLFKRFNDAIPNETEREKHMHSLIEESKRIIQGLKKQAAETHQQAIERGENKWYYYIPYIGACILIYDRIKQKGLLDTLNDLNKRTQDEEAKATKESKDLTIAFNQVNSLTTMVKDVKDTIGNAIKAVAKMQTAFSILASDFKRLRDRIEDVDGDIDEKGMEALVAKKDLEKAQETWESIQTMAKQFQMHGVVLAANDSLL